MGDVKLEKIKQIALVQHDVAKAVPFYRDGLGLPLQFEIAGMAFFDAGRRAPDALQPERAGVRPPQLDPLL